MLTLPQIISSEDLSTDAAGMAHQLVYMARTMDGSSSSPDFALATLLAQAVLEIRQLMAQAQAPIDTNLKPTRFWRCTECGEVYDPDRPATGWKAINSIPYHHHVVPEWAPAVRVLLPPSDYYFTGKGNPSSQTYVKP